MRVRDPNDQTCEAVRFELPVERAKPIVPGPVSVDVATFQTSEARVPKVVSERVADDQTLSGMVEASEVEAVRTVAFVLVLMVMTALLMFEVIDDEAFRMLVLTAARVEPRDEEAFKTFVFVVLMFVFAVARVAPSEVEARFVFVLMTPARDVDAVFKLANVASVPTESVASVRLRVPNDQTCAAVKLPPPPALTTWYPMVPRVVSVEVATFQTSEARVPKVVSERVPDDQTLRGMVEASEVEAVRTVASV